MKTATKLRKSGIDCVGNINWGAHICQFYQTEKELAEILVPYFKCGLEENEYCLWFTSQPSEVDNAKTALKRAKINLDDYIGKGQIDILDYKTWCDRLNTSDYTNVLNGLIEKERIARKKGFNGLRVCWNVSWLGSKDWGDFQNFEAVISSGIETKRIVFLCSYSIDRLMISDIAQVVDGHESTIFQWEGKWVFKDNTVVTRFRHQLESSETRYRRLFETAQDGILILNADSGKIIDVNPYLEAMLEYSHKEFLGKRLWEIGPFKDIQASRESFQELQSKQYVRYEHLPLETKSGKQISVEFVSNVYPIDGDRVIQCNIRDITVRKHAEEALEVARKELKTRVKERTSQLAKANEELGNENRERKKMEESLKTSEQNFHNSLDSSWLGIRIGDVGEGTFYANQAFLDLFGYENIDEVRTSPPSEYYTPESYAAFVLRKEKVSRGQPISNTVEVDIVRKDGTIRHIQISRQEISWNGKQEYQVIYNDITERKRSEEELKASGERFRTLTENTSDLVWELDNNGVYTYVNPKVKDILGYNPEEVIGKTPFDFMPEKNRANLTRRFQGITKPQGPLIRRENAFIRKDGRLIILETNGVPFFSQDGRFGGYRGIDRDITERKQAQDELNKATKLESISILAGGIAHDFNNLLTGILGNITLAQRYVEKGGNTFDRLVDAERASLMAKDLTQQLLTFSGGGAPIKKPTAISSLIKESVAFSLSGSNVRCDFNIPDNLWAADIDEAQINRVINNVVINADQAMPQGGVINVGVENMVIKSKSYLPLPKGNYLKVTIKDHGTGIPEKLLSRIFEPYFTTKKKGSGLGLATAYSIVKNHGGYMAIESKLGEGTTVYIYIPATNEPVPVVAKKADEGYTGGGRRVLVMDDEEMIRKLLHNSLTEIGYRVELAKDGTEAIEKYAEANKSGRSFDAVILDLTIPGGLGGKETIKRLLEINSNIKAIASSGYTHDSVMANYQKYGFSGIISKPFHIAAMEKILQDVIFESESKTAIKQNFGAPNISVKEEARILVMDDAQVVISALKENLPELGYKVEFARNGDQAISLYKQAIYSGHRFDIALIDLNIAKGLGGEETIKKLIEIDPNIQAIASSGYPTEAAMLKPEKFGFRAAIAKPYRIEELSELLNKVMKKGNSLLV